MTIRTFLYLGLAALASVFLSVMPATATGFDPTPGIHATHYLDGHALQFDSFVVSAVIHEVQPGGDHKPIAFGSIGLLHPAYEHAMATDALNFVDVRRRC